MRPKIVTLCGSIRFWGKIQEMAERLELENHFVVIGITPHIMKRDFTPEEEERLDELHREKIKISDAIFVLNVDGYIGKSTASEIAFAKELGKEILYLEPHRIA